VVLSTIAKISAMSSFVEHYTKNTNFAGKDSKSGINKKTGRLFAETLPVVITHHP
jgi:hypothetical protein